MNMPVSQAKLVQELKEAAKEIRTVFLDTDNTSIADLISALTNFNTFLERYTAVIDKNQKVDSYPDLYQYELGVTKEIQNIIANCKKIINKKVKRLEELNKTKSQNFVEQAETIMQEIRALNTAIQKIQPNNNLVNLEFDKKNIAAQITSAEAIFNEIQLSLVQPKMSSPPNMAVHEKLTKETELRKISAKIKKCDEDIADDKQALTFEKEGTKNYNEVKASLEMQQLKREIYLKIQEYFLETNPANFQEKLDAIEQAEKNFDGYLKSQRGFLYSGAEGEKEQAANNEFKQIQQENDELIKTFHANMALSNINFLLQKRAAIYNEIYVLIGEEAGDYAIKAREQDLEENEQAIEKMEDAYCEAMSVTTQEQEALRKNLPQHPQLKHNFELFEAARNKAETALNAKEEEKEKIQAQRRALELETAIVPEQGAAPSALPSQISRLEVIATEELFKKLSELRDDTHKTTINKLVELQSHQTEAVTSHPKYKAIEQVLLLKLQQELATEMQNLQLQLDKIQTRFDTPNKLTPKDVKLAVDLAQRTSHLAEELQKISGYKNMKHYQDLSALRKKLEENLNTAQEKYFPKKSILKEAKNKLTNPETTWRKIKQFVTSGPSKDEVKEQVQQLQSTLKKQK